MKLTDRQGILILIGVLVVGMYLGFIPDFGIFDQAPAPPQLDITPPTPQLPGVSREATNLEFTVANIITKDAITATNTKVDVFKVSDGVIDFMNKAESTITVNSDPEQSTGTYSQGDTVILHVSSDTGNDYYDRWYYATLTEGVPVRRFTPALVTGTKDADGFWKYQFKPGLAGVKTGYEVQYTSGDPAYWGLSILGIVPRVTSAQLDTFATLSTTTLSSVTDGSTWDTTAGSRDKAMATTDEEAFITLEGDTVSLGFGSPMLYITGKGEIQERVSVVIVSTTMTAIDADKLSDEGWKTISDSTLTAEKAWYHVVSEQIPVQGDKFSYDIKLPIDSSGASSTTDYTFKVWVLDMQLISNIEDGSSSSSVPSSYGGISQYGLDAIVHAKAYSTTSGAGTGQVLTFVLTTPT